MAQVRSLHASVGIITISGGSLLLLVHNYGSSPEKNFIPHSALGLLLLSIAFLLAYAGVRRSAPHSQLFSTLCLTVSALWCGSGLVYILLYLGSAWPLLELSWTLIPGLVGFAVALLIVAAAAVVAKKTVLFLIAAGLGLACAHQIAGLWTPGFGLSAAAANYLLVCLTGAYFGFGRLLTTVTRGKVVPPGTEPRVKPAAAAAAQQTRGRGEATLAAAGLVMNLVSASALACPLLSIVPLAPVGHVPWLWTAGLFQLGVCVLLYRAMDTLGATFYGFMALLKFADGCSVLRLADPAHVTAIVPAVLAALLATLALFSLQKSLLEGLYHLLFVVYCIVLAVEGTGFSQGAVQGAIFLMSAALLFITTYNMASARAIPTGSGCFGALVSRLQGVVLRAQDKELHSPHLGYSKYADAEVLGHASGLLAASAMTAALLYGSPASERVVPWAVVAGGVLQLLSGFVAFSRGKSFESTVFTLHGMMWAVWGPARYAGLYQAARGFGVAVGVVGFMLFNGFAIAAAALLNAAWLAHTLAFQLVLVSFLLDAVGAAPFGYDVGVVVVFGGVSFYCFLAHAFNGTFQAPQIPLGRPLIKLSGTEGGASVCPHLPARKASSVERIAEIMKSGGICGVPTDTVYVLVAACNRPDAVVKAYSVKTQAQDRPMSMWISSIRQLDPVRHLLSPLLLDFMEAAWPSSISMVIPRGPWMDAFGLGDAAKHIGTPQSIAIRNPDCSVATHLISRVGPIAVTSANPTGEADTTHHNQVYAKLGNKVEGVLCDGASPENIASTVVDCTKIETGHIGFFRVGLIPKSKVLQIFEEVQKKHQQGQINPGFEYDTYLGPLQRQESSER